jgi:hypothetical protein
MNRDLVLGLAALGLLLSIAATPVVLLVWELTP